MLFPRQDDSCSAVLFLLLDLVSWSSHLLLFATSFPSLVFVSSGKRRPGQRRVARRLGWHEVDGEEFESNPATLLVQGARTPLLQIGIVDPPRFEHAAGEPAARGSVSTTSASAEPSSDGRAIIFADDGTVHLGEKKKNQEKLVFHQIQKKKIKNINHNK